MNTIASRLRALREERQMSQNDVAKILGISRTAYVKYETGDSKPTRKLKELSSLFNVSTDYLLGNDENSVKSKPTKEPKDLKKFLEQSEVMFDGDTYNLTPEEKEMVMQSLKVAFYAAKRANKRKKDDSPKKDHP